MIEDIKITPEAGTEFTVIPEGSYQAVIDDIALIDQPKYREPSIMEKVLMFRFALLEGGELVGRYSWKRMKPVVSPGFANGQPSNLYELIKACDKKDPELDKEYDAEDINGLLDKQVMLIIKVQKTKKGDREYNKISDIMVVKKDIKVPKEILDQRAEMAKKKAEKAIEAPVKDEIKVEEIPFDKDLNKS